MTSLTTFVLRHKLLVALVWLAVGVAGFLMSRATTANMTNNAAMPGTAYRVDSRIVDTYGNGGGSSPLAPASPRPPTRITAGSAAAARRLAALRAAAGAVPGSRLVDLASTSDGAFVTADGRTTFGLLYTVPPTSFSGPDPSAALSRALAASLPPGWTSGVTGSTLLSAGSSSSSQGTGVLVEALIGGVGALVILALVFGSYLAVLPVVIGAPSVLAAFLAVGALEQVVEVSQIVEFVIALIGLGIAIDYSLLVVTRWREERAAGADRHDAVVRAMEHAGRAVVFSGVTVAIGLLSLVVIPVPFLRSVGYGGVLVAARLACSRPLTLLPVILATAGRLARPPPPSPRPRTQGQPVLDGVGRLAYRRRWIAAGVGTLTLALLALPALGLTLGEPGASSQAPSGRPRTLARLVEGGVLSVSSRRCPGCRPTRWRSSYGRWTACGAAAVPTDASSVPGAVVVSVLPRVESTLPAGQDAVRAVQAAVEGNGDVVGVGGSGAWTVDFVHAVYGQLPAAAHPDRDRHVPAACEGVPVRAARREGGRAQPRLARRGLRDPHLGVAAGPRQRGGIRRAGDRRDHDVGAADGLRLLVRAVDGL